MGGTKESVLVVGDNERWRTHVIQRLPWEGHRRALLASSRFPRKEGDCQAIM